MSPQDRRKAPRHRPVLDRLHLIWWSETGLKHTLGRLGDLSSSGAAIMTECPLPGAAPIWVGLVDAIPITWVRGEIVWSSTITGDRQRYGLRFSLPCPNSFFRRAIWGDLRSVADANEGMDHAGGHAFPPGRLRIADFPDDEDGTDRNSLAARSLARPWGSATAACWSLRTDHVAEVIAGRRRPISVARRGAEAVNSPLAMSARAAAR